MMIWLWWRCFLDVPLKINDEKSYCCCYSVVLVVCSVLTAQLPPFFPTPHIFHRRIRIKLTQQHKHRKLHKNVNFCWAMCTKKSFYIMLCSLFLCPLLYLHFCLLCFFLLPLLFALFFGLVFGETANGWIGWMDGWMKRDQEKLLREKPHKQKNNKATFRTASELFQLQCWK